MIKNTQGEFALIFAAAAFLLVIGLLYALLKFFPAFTGGITAKESAIIDLGNVIVVFSFISLALQSALGVFVSNWRGQKRTQKQRRVNNLKEDVDELKTLIEPIRVSATELNETTGTASSRPSASTSQQNETTGQRPSFEPAQLTDLREQLAETKEKLETAENDLDLYRDQTKAIVTRLSLLAGITISLAGVRILQPLTNVTLEGQQLSLFNAVDILLTGGLLAGGSEGVHRLTRVYEKVTDLSQTVGK